MVLLQLFSDMAGCSGLLATAVDPSNRRALCQDDSVKEEILINILRLWPLDAAVLCKGVPQI
jgi:hypothetical protein